MAQVKQSVTGRLSSSTPNVQAIPARTREVQRLLRPLTAPYGRQVVSSDFPATERRALLLK